MTARDSADCDAPTYKFTEAHPAAVGYGPAMAVRLRSTDTLLGFVRRINGSRSWVVYDPEGAEVGISDQRKTAANFLHREHTRVTPPGDGAS